MKTFTFEILPKKGYPLYRQLYDYIAQEIKSGNFLADEKLPSKRTLSNHLKISQITIETAYEQLIAEGYVYSKPKTGYYVSQLDQFLLAPKEQRAAKDAKAPLVTRQRESKRENQREMYRFDFRTNEVDTRYFPFATWAKLSKESLQAQNKELLKTALPQGDLALRESIAQYLHEFRGVHCHADQLVVGAGTEYLLGLLAQILGRTSVFAVENPGYRKTYKVLDRAGLQVRFVALDDEGMQISGPRGLEQSGANIAYVTPSHHFPLGIVMPINRRLQLLHWAAAASDRYVIEDDYDSEFRYAGAPIPALQGLDGDGKVIYLSTFSKCLAPSLRISYMVLPASLLAHYQKDFTFYASTVSRFEQQTLFKFISGGHFERHLNRMRNIYRARRDLLIAQLHAIDPLGQIQISGDQAGTHVLLTVRNGLSERQLIAAAAKCGVKVYGLSDYYFVNPATAPASTVVLGYSSFALSELEESVALLGAAWF